MVPMSFDLTPMTYFPLLFSALPNYETVFYSPSVCVCVCVCVCVVRTMFTKPHDVNVRSRSLLKNKDIRQIRQHTALQLELADTDTQQQGAAAGTGSVAGDTPLTSTETNDTREEHGPGPRSISDILTGKVRVHFMPSRNYDHPCTCYVYVYYRVVDWSASKCKVISNYTHSNRPRNRQKV